MLPDFFSKIPERTGDWRGIASVLPVVRPGTVMRQAMLPAWLAPGGVTEEADSFTRRAGFSAESLAVAKFAGEGRVGLEAGAVAEAALDGGIGHRGEADQADEDQDVTFHSYAGLVVFLFRSRESGLRKGIWDGRRLATKPPGGEGESWQRVASLLFSQGIRKSLGGREKTAPAAIFPVGENWCCLTAQAGGTCMEDEQP